MASSGESSRRNKRKAPKPIPIDFEVFEGNKVFEELKLIKPKEDNCERNVRMKPDKYPSVMVKNESSHNDHAHQIMHVLNHKNIICMKGLMKLNAKVKDKSSVSALVSVAKELRGHLDPHFVRKIADEYGFVPSSTFQRMVSGLAEGIHFLKRNETYHGNLRWMTTFCAGVDEIKLANFKKKEASVSLKEAQWMDWTCFMHMLDEISKFISERNLDPNVLLKFFPDLLDELIGILKASDTTSLDVIKDKILESMFFWNSGRKAKFFMNSVSPLLSQWKFLKEIEDSEVCDLPWNWLHSVDGVNDLFDRILEKMNSYRDGLLISHYDFHKKIDCVKWVCAAYTHRKELQLDIDPLVRAKYPKMCMELKRIIDNRSLPEGSGVEKQKYGNNGTVTAYEEKLYAPSLESLAEAPHQEGDAASASQEASCKIEVPNRKVGVLIGKADETIRNLQMSSGAKIQITKDVYTSNALTQSVELVGTLGSVDKAKLNKNVTAQAEADSSPAVIARGFGNGQSGSEQYQMTVVDNKLIPQHALEGVTLTEGTVVTGNKNQIKNAKDLVNEAMNQNLSKHADKSGGYGQQDYHPQGHVAASQRGPCSQSQLGYESPYYDYPQCQSPHGSMGWNSPHPSYQGGGSDYYKLPYQSQPGYGYPPQNHNPSYELAPGCEHLYPRYNAPPMNWHYEQPPIEPSQYYLQLPDFYARRYQAGPADPNNGSAYPQSGYGAGQWRP